MKVYFDTCSLNRPLDDKAQLRVSLEAEAILSLLALCNSGAASLYSSEVLFLENERNSPPQRRAFVEAILKQAKTTVVLTPEIKCRGTELESRGFKAFDALHVACAEAGMVDYFCTCDDRLLRKARNQVDLSVKVVSPLELAGEVLP